jgi:hypothetical protein
VRATIEPQGPPEPDAASSPLWKRLIWFAGIAVAASAVTAAVAYGLKALMPNH